MEKEYDVVIVGAGPGGLNCAQHLSKSNLKVLLLEKNKIIGPKICGGGLSTHAIEYLKLPLNVPDYKFSELTIHTPLQKATMKREKPFVYTIDRKVLGQWMLKKLEKTKTEIRVGAVVTKVTKNYVVINNKEKIKFKYLVGAGGASSIVRRYLKLKTEFGITMQYVIPTKKYKKFEFFYDSKAFNAFYVWIFPHKNYVSIGCGADPAVLTHKKLRDNFEKWIKDNKVDISKGKYKTWPISHSYEGYKFGNVFLVGEAAGLASVLSGGGIYPALVSGEDVAKTILNPKYKSTKINKIVKRNKKHLKLIKSLERKNFFRGFALELFALMVKSGWFDKKMIEFIL